MLLPFRQALGLTPSGLLLAALLLPSFPGDGRLPVPEAGAQDAALVEIRRIYKSEYSVARSGPRLELAKKMLALAADETMKEDTTGRFVLLSQSRDLAAEVGDVPTCMAAIDQLSGAYLVEGLPMKVESIAGVVKRGGPSAGAENITLGLDLCDQCLAIDDFEAAGRLVVAIKPVVGRAGDAKLNSRLKLAEAAIGEYEKVRPQIERLRTEPANPDACLAVGRYYCFVRQDFESGGPLLARSCDDVLKRLGESDSQAPIEAAKRRELGDAWSEWAQGQQGTTRRSATWRAVYWYKLAAPDLTGIPRLDVDKRLAVLDPDKSLAEEAGKASTSPARVLRTATPRHVRREVPWAEVLEDLPDPAKVTDAKLLRHIQESGFPWRVRERVSGVEMLLVPSGEFQRGASPGDPEADGNRELPRHKVVITSPFYIGRYEIQNSEWEHVMNGAASQPDTLGFPMWASPDSAAAFMGKCPGLRLPTEAEWEYACRAGTTESRYASVDECAWSPSNSEGKVHPVGQKRPNALGLHDMLGNLWEICSDYYEDAAYANCTSGVRDPQGPATGIDRVMRGGNFNARGVDAWCRASTRTPAEPGKVYSTRGFRVARTP